jgi:hypothetical protein
MCGPDWSGNFLANAGIRLGEVDRTRYPSRVYLVGKVV